MTSATINAAREAMRGNRPQEAEARAKAVLARQPADVDALEIVALLARGRGNLAEAEEAFRRIVTIDPAAAWAWTDLARVLIDCGRPADAERAVRRALVVSPDNADAHALLGGFLSAREALVEGGWHLRRAIALAEPPPALLADLGRNLLRQGVLGEAATLAEQAAASDPDSLAAAVLLAEVCERQGRLDAAEAALGRAERIAAAAGRDVKLARATLLSRGPRWREALALLERQPGLSGAALLLRGRLRDPAGRYDEAWADFVAGKAALGVARGRRYDPAGVEALFAALASIPAELPRASRRSDQPQPIFILGLPRSGTTLAEQVLASHGAIRAGGELPFVAEMRDLAQRQLGEGSPFPAGLDTLGQADRRHLPALFRDLYLGRAAVHGLTAEGAAFFTDKMPLNEAFLPLILLAFPESAMVHVRRHPLDVLVSMLSHDMTHGFGCGDRAEDIAHHIAAMAALSTSYRRRHEGAPHDLVYERLVADGAGEIARLMAAIGLPPEPAQLRFHENPRHAPTPSYAQVTEPLHARAVGRWRNYARQLEPLMPILAGAIAAHEAL